jgi:hypothetical protein
MERWPKIKLFEVSKNWFYDTKVLDFPQVEHNENCKTVDHQFVTMWQGILNCLNSYNQRFYIVKREDNFETIFFIVHVYV